MPSSIADFTDRERWVIRTTLDERWSDSQVPLHDTDIEVRLKPGDDQGTPCPGLFWNVNGCNFVVIKTGTDRYRCQFFYNDLTQVGPDVTEYTELAECVVQLLQAQADYARILAGSS